MSSIFKSFEEWKKKFNKYFNQDYHIDMLNDEPAVNGRLRIPKRHYIAAEVCNEIYKDPNLRQKQIDTYILDTRYNDTRTVVYKNSLLYDDSFIIGIRGTSTNIFDLLSDSLIAIGKETLSIRKYIQTNYINKIIQQLTKEGYNPSDSYLTGHSLGALLSAYILQVVPNLTGIGFNTGTSPLHIPKVARFNPRFTPVLDGVANTNRFVNYHVKGDLLSVSSTYLFQDTVILTTNPPPNSIQAHRITYILQETQPNPPFIR